MAMYRNVTEQEFFAYLETCDFPVGWMGNGEMGRDYFNKTTGKLVARYGHGMMFNTYTMVDQDDEGDEYTRDRKEEYFRRLQTKK